MLAALTQASSAHLEGAIHHEMTLFETVLRWLPPVNSKNSAPSRPCMAMPDALSFSLESHRCKVRRGKPMAKAKRKPQGRPRASSTSQTAVSSSPNRGHDKSNELSANSSPRWRGKLYDHWVELVAGGFVVLFVSLWVTEYREHEGTKQQLARSEDSRKQAEDGQKQVMAERDQIRRELASLRQENADLKKLHPILEFYGPYARYTASYDLPKQAGSLFSMGKCPNEPCIEVEFREISKGADGLAAVVLRIGGEFGISAHGRPIIVRVPTRRNCKVTMTAGSYKITVAIEEEQFQVLKVGVGASVINPPQSGIFRVEPECPEG
jgi:hypothetical protein